MSNKLKPKCAVCGETTFHVSWRRTYGDKLVGYYCRVCKMLYPIKGIRIGKDRLYLGLRCVTE